MSISRSLMSWPDISNERSAAACTGVGGRQDGERGGNRRRRREGCRGAEFEHVEGVASGVQVRIRGVRAEHHRFARAPSLTTISARSPGERAMFFESDGSDSSPPSVAISSNGRSSANAKSYMRALEPFSSRRRTRSVVTSRYGPTVPLTRIVSPSAPSNCPTPPTKAPASSKERSCTMSGKSSTP